MSAERLLQEIDAVPGAIRNSGATPDELIGFESRSGVELTDELRQFYQACNGAKLHDTFVILPLFEAEQELKFLEENGSGFPGRLLPVVRNDVWNTVAVCCDGALRGYYLQLCWELVEFPLKWRSFERFLTLAVSYCCARENWNINELPTEFGDARTPADIAAGREILRSLNECGQTDAARQYKAEYGCELLGDGQLDEMAALFDDEDSFVARNARDRVARLGTAQSKDLLEQYWSEVHKLLMRTAHVLEKNGFRSTFNSSFDLRSEPGKIAWSWEALYSQRRRTDFDAWVLGRAKCFAELRRKSG